MSRAAQPPRSAAPASPADWLAWPAWAMVLLLFVVTLLAYLPALRAGFIWDDGGHVTRPDLRSLAGLLRIWFQPGQTQQYYPLLHTAFWIEHRLWGDSPAGYHAVNILLHATAACLFGFVLRRLVLPGAWLAALLFALHPVGVESVAWIAEQKNTLSAVLYFAATLAYLRFDETRAGSRYAVATVLFLLALLTKSVTATLPAALLVIFWWRRGRVVWRADVQPLLPWFVLGGAAGLFTSWFERTWIGAQGGDFSLSLIERGLLAGRVIWFYLGKLFWPGELLFIYPRWDVDASVAWQYAFPLGVLGLLAGLTWWQHRYRGPLAAFLFFSGTLFPVLGFLNVYPFVYSFVADHFQYLASCGIFALSAAGIMMLVGQLPPRAGWVAIGVLLTGLGALTWRQCGKYRDVIALYESTLAGNPASWMAHNNLALALTDLGRIDEAMEHLRQALALRPGFAEAENNLGDNLHRLGRSEEAMAHFQRALELQPDFAEARCNLGIALLALNRPAEALVPLEAAVRIRPDDVGARYQLGVALIALNRPAEGVAAFEAALAIKSDYALAYRGLGRALATTGQSAAALPHFERAVELAPDDAETRIDLGFALLLAGRAVAAVPQLQEAVNLRPDFPPAHNLLGRALNASGRFDEAILHFAEAVRLNPDFAEARQNLAHARQQAGLAP